MRVLQLIDSLRPGGAEQMAVSYSNAFISRLDGSYLCCTRIEGILQKKLLPDVGYLFLERKNILDLVAILNLRKFIKKNRIDIIQAHSTSFFLALLIKLSLPGLKLVWHDHYGRELETRKSVVLKLASRYFNGIISVNTDLAKWAEENLYTKNIRYFENFLPIKISLPSEKKLGGGNEYKIICLANFRPQKDHINLLKAFKLLTLKNNQVTLHLIGKDDENGYSKGIKSFIIENNLEEKVYLYGEQEEPETLLFHANIGVLSSVSEGLPLALIEYGAAGLPVVTTAVGQCPSVIGKHGKLVASKDSEALFEALLYYLENEDKRRIDALNFQAKIKREFSEETVMPKVIRFLESL